MHGGSIQRCDMINGELIVDNFAGVGGANTGIEIAVCFRWDG